MRPIYLRFIFAFLFLLVLQLPASKLVHAGGNVNNGGGKLRALFHDAQLNAVAKLSRLNHCSLPDKVDPRVSNWLIENREALIDDIKYTALQVLNNPDQPDCASTEKKAYSKITLSYRICREENYTLEEATRLIIHETVHHFDTKDEDEKFAEDIARTAIEADKNHKDFCVSDPVFDVSSCVGSPLKNSDIVEYLENNPINTTIGEFSTYIRTRACESPNTCLTPWKEYKPAGLAFYNQDGKEVKVLTEGDVNLVRNQDASSISLRTIGLGTACDVENAHCAIRNSSEAGEELYFYKGQSQPFALKQEITKDCLRQEALIIDYEEALRREVQIVVYGKLRLGSQKFR